jgi:hypothetical protein
MEYAGDNACLSRQAWPFGPQAPGVLAHGAPGRMSFLSADFLRFSIEVCDDQPLRNLC